MSRRVTIRRRHLLAGMSAVAVSPVLGAGAALAQGRDGTLPPPAQRLPAVPSVVRSFAGSDGPGKAGGTIDTLVGSERDTRLMTLYGYTRLVAFDPDLSIRADILESCTVEEGRR